MNARFRRDGGRRSVLTAAFVLVTALFVGMLYSGAYGEGQVGAPGCPGSAPASGPGSGPGGSFPGSGPGGSFPGSGPGGSFPGSGPVSAPGGSCPGSEPGSEPPPPPPCPDDEKDKDKGKPPKDKPPKDKDGDGCPDKDDDDHGHDDHGNDDHGHDDHGNDDHGHGNDHDADHPGRPGRGGAKPVRGQSLPDILSNGLKVELICPAGGCRAHADLTVTTRVRASRTVRNGVGAGGKRMGRAGRAVFTVKLTRHWRARFRRAKSVKLTLRTLVTSAGGDSVRNHRITLRR
jgi:hypothetical protein